MKLERNAACLSPPHGWSCDLAAAQVNATCDLAAAQVNVICDLAAAQVNATCDLAAAQVSVICDLAAAWVNAAAAAAHAIAAAFATSSSTHNVCRVVKELHLQLVQLAMRAPAAAASSQAAVVGQG
jgi:hypothetical protein